MGLTDVLTRSELLADLLSLRRNHRSYNLPVDGWRWVFYSTTIVSAHSTCLVQEEALKTPPSRKQF